MKQLMLTILILAVSGFFLFAGGSKLPDIPAFYQSILNYRIVDGLAAWAGALYLPWLECIAAIALWFRPTRNGAALVLGGLLLFFQGALASAAVRSLDIDCGCLASGNSSSVEFALARNTVLLGLLIAIFLLGRHSRAN